MLGLAFEILYAIAARSVADIALEEASRRAVRGGPAPSNSTVRLNAFTNEFYAVRTPMIAHNRIVLAVMASASIDIGPAGPNATGGVASVRSTAAG